MHVKNISEIIHPTYFSYIIIENCIFRSAIICIHPRLYINFFIIQQKPRFLFKIRFSSFIFQGLSFNSLNGTIDLSVHVLLHVKVGLCERFVRARTIAWLIAIDKIRHANQSTTTTRDMNGRFHGGIRKLVRIFAKLLQLQSCSHVLTSYCGICVTKVFVRESTFLKSP